MNASAQSVTQLAVAGSAGAAQGVEAGTTDRPRAGTAARSARRSARFSELLDGLVESDGLTEDRRKPGKALADGTGTACPFLPPMPGNTTVRSTGFGGMLESTADAGPAASGEFTVETLSFPPSSPSLEEFGAPAKEAMSREGEGAPSFGDGQPPASNRSPDLEMPLRTIKDNGAWPLIPEISVQGAPGQPGLPSQLHGTTAGATLGLRASSGRKMMERSGFGEHPFPELTANGREEDRTEQRFPEEATELAAATDAPTAPSIPDPVRAYFAVPPGAETIVGAVAPTGAATEWPGGSAPTGLAFTARVVPLPAPEAAVPATAAEKQLPEAAATKPDPARTSAVPAPPDSKVLKDNASGNARTTDFTPSAAEPRVLPSFSPATSVEPLARPAADSRTTEPPAPPPQQTSAAEERLAPPAAPAREIQLQFHQGEQRVDVRLTERSGEVRVAVRTPDAPLADALRAGLPALSTRLEQTGFRAETWHPAMVQESARHAAHAHSSFSDSSDSQNGSKQGGQQQPQPRQQKPNAAHAAAKSQRKEFRWLMSQLP